MIQRLIYIHMLPALSPHLSVFRLQWTVEFVMNVCGPALHYPLSFRLSFRLSSCISIIERQCRGYARLHDLISHTTIPTNTIHNLVDQHWVLQGTVV